MRDLTPTLLVEVTVLVRVPEQIDETTPVEWSAAQAVQGYVQTDTPVLALAAKIVPE